MRRDVHKARFASIIDTLTLPLRALFIGTEGGFGLSSLREERMRIVANYCKVVGGEGRVLDVGCGPGNLFIKEFIRDENGVGVDVFPYEGVTNIKILQIFLIMSYPNKNIKHLSKYGKKFQFPWRKLWDQK